MRKVLTALASGALVLTLAAPAWAAPARPQSPGIQTHTERDCRDRNHSDRDFRHWGRWDRDHRDRDHRDGEYRHGFCR